MDRYFTTIGLEVHVELKTRTKMFCACLNDAKEIQPNKNVCPICLAHPGTLPVINLEAVKKVIRVGLSLSGKIPERSLFDRKNYFYPDLPKGYQISQYEHPLVSGGFLEINNEAGEKNKIAITRVHLEEDTGKLSHQGKNSLIDFNRAGVPLMELVTEPVIHSGPEARKFAEELRLLLRYLDVSDAEMENGQLRIEPNISVSKTEKLGTKVEIKNLNSFRSVEDSINFEVQRQIKILESGDKIFQTNRGWNQEKSETFEQRSKEEAHDYRYFPEPDLPPLVIGSTAPKAMSGRSVFIDLREIKNKLPELPWQRRERLAKLYGLEISQIEFLVQEKNAGDFFEEAASEFRSIDAKHKKESDVEKSKIIFNLISSDMRGLMAGDGISYQDLKTNPADISRLAEFFHLGKISSRAMKDILVEMFKTGQNPEEIIAAKNLLQVSDISELEAIALEVIKVNPGPVKDFQSGKEQALQFLVGKVMAKTKGKANPSVLQDLIRKSI
ncbi:MAG: glutaminyl-tRNA synthase (glutamine-hydrolyzing) subunit B [Candidatus Brennerbacteria bacterium RIFOXYC1_FULL_41_11]|nr:MAG: glutaminyl-tRNA synthase (glutamine-hydrolyzing) subunit B [Candidatus Brennerbacteria bacterium RIFOXYC1_FULL_41_11]